MISAVVTDIEGTTSSLSFVKDVLFPYARGALPAFVRDHGHDEAVRPLLLEARALAHLAPDAADQALVEVLQGWIDDDVKIAPLKSLQGLIWRAAYERGDFAGHIYPDAVEALRHWHRRGVALYVFSSGSVEAQRLLFRHSQAGNLEPLFRGYFDTHTGPKRDPESYRKICAVIGVPPSQVLFLSDTQEEIDAAKRAGLATRRLLRDPESTDSDGISDFSLIQI